MKKIVWAGFLISIVSFIVWSKNPIDDTVNFIIGGSIPGTNTSIGFWSVMILIVAILYLVYRGIKSTKLEMLSHTAKQIKSEQARAEFEEANSGEFDRSKRSVIAAPSAEANIF